MSSDLFIYDSNLQFMPDDPPFPLCDSTMIDSLDILFPDPIDQLSSAANCSPLLSTSPPSHQLESLSLHTAVSSDFTGWFPDHTTCSFGSVQEGTVKAEGSPVGYEAFAGPHSYGGHESGFTNAVKYMQRSYSINSLEEKQAAALFHPQFDAVMESADHLQGQAGMMSSPESCIPGAQMRRVCSAGDLQRSSLSSPLRIESAFPDEANLKVGRYSVQERKERILKYRAKRTQRNFTKTIKYACRKTLADTRPRIRGRFARNDEIGELPKAPCSTREDDDEDHDLWLALQEEGEFGAGRGGPFLGNSYGQTQFNYSYGYQN
ncbi:hypothetical protein CDL15_Pgr028088 [Punica granatum]|uniref:CCT domain-containing protein n=1 Tax=Punica granatum TaxID=22663 RepID=A0A218XLE4_PUNGR|nr:hypothetical protein CDL15_Pgr028088 [Punica granatum]